MNAIPDLGDLLASLIDGVPWPALLVDDPGNITFANAALLRDKGAAGAIVGRSLAQAFPGVAARLRGNPPWLETQDVAGQDPATGVPERICVRRLALGACITIFSRTDVPESTVDGAQAARLAALGFMVAGVCHEVANPLAAIHSMVQLLQSGSPLSPETIERGLENIASNVKRVIGITGKLNAFSRAGDVEKAPLPLDRILASAQQNLALHPLFRNVDVQRDAAADAWIAGIDHEIEQVFSNIFLNAAQAMNGTGRLFISSSRLAVDRIEIAIRDTGPGIAPGHLPHLMEPFFTTRPVGQGTGLGLAISNEIVIEHGGSLRAENHASGGACFYVNLPLSTPHR